MFCDNLISLRKLNGLSQEELAEQLNVSRQTLSKYETGESLPDIDRCKQLAEIFGVTLDDLVNYDSAATGLNVPPKGKHAFGLVTVGDKGQIVIPAKARKIFNIQPGDRLIVLGDEAQGLALLSEKDFLSMVRSFRTQTKSHLSHNGQVALLYFQSYRSHFQKWQLYGSSVLPPPKSWSAPVMRSTARPQPASKWASYGLPSALMATSTRSPSA